MYILPVNQPYAELIIRGYKRYETRSTKTNIRGKIAIYANRVKIARDIKESVGKDIMQCTYFGILDWNECCDTEKYGVIIGTCQIVDCLRAEKICSGASSFEECVGNYDDGRFAWQIEKPVMFEKPIPSRLLSYNTRIKSI